VTEKPKGFIHFVRDTLDSDELLLQCVAAFGIAAREEGDTRETWYGRATKALEKATDSATMYYARKKSNGEVCDREVFFQTEYGGTVDDEEEEKKVIELIESDSDQSDEEKSIFPDTEAMMHHMAEICVDHRERRDVLLLIEVVFIGLDTNELINGQSIERILAEEQKSKRAEGIACDVFELKRDGVRRKFGIICGDDTKARLTLEKIHQDIMDMPDSYWPAYGPGTKAGKCDSTDAWYERADQSLEAYRKMEPKSKEEQEQRSRAFIRMQCVRMYDKHGEQQPAITDPSYTSWFSKMHRLVEKRATEMYTKRQQLRQQRQQQQQPKVLVQPKPLDHNSNAIVDEVILEGYRPATTNKSNTLKSNVLMALPSAESEDDDDGLEYSRNMTACDICQKQYCYESAIPKRKVPHSQRRPWECHLCPKTFKRRRGLNRHLQRQHGSWRNTSTVVCDSCRNRGLEL